VPFGGRIDIAPHFGVKCPQNVHFAGVNRRFKANALELSKVVIPTAFCTAIKTSKYSSRVAPKSKMADGRHLENDKLLHYQQLLADFDDLYVI